MTDVAETLLPVLNEAIATILDKEALFKVVSNELRQIFPFDLLVISVFDAEMKNERLFLRAHADGNQYVSMPVVPLHFAAIGGSPLEDLLSAPGVGHTALVDSLARYPNAESLRQMWAVGIRYRTCVPLRRGGRLIGALTLATRCPAARSAADDALLEKIGALVAAAVANTLAFEDLARREQERTLQLTIGTALLSIKRREPLFRAIAGALSHVVPFQYFGIRVQRAGQPKVPEDCAEFRRGSGPDSALETVAIDHGQWPDQQEDHRLLDQQVRELLQVAGLHTGDDFKALAVRSPLMRHKYDADGIRAVLIVPLWQRTDGIALLLLSSPDAHGFGPSDLATAQAVTPQVALALENLFAFEQIEALKAQVEQERTYLINEINTTAAGKELIGPSAAMRTVRVRIAQVAPTATTVLVSGETGTGKELVARALHNASPRHARAFVKLNCAALPAQLIESELFGHEKGSFTGATERRIGKFELANGGTIFLDEIGEMPLDLQTKLLRVLQEKEFERVGGNRVLTTDARVVAATNRVLEDEVAAGRFRADLYYRLNVFPITLPPLRTRPEDIEPLLRHAARHLSRRLAKPRRPVRPADLATLHAYAWPGNVRELEHLVERALIVSQGPYLDFSLAVSGASAAEAAEPVSVPFKTLSEHERAHILAALARTGGRVSGPLGAALLLGINPKTLETRMKKLGICRTVSMS